ncbi:unnamed protein product [Larinioides sclopetarius]|uniref:Uncharacterized protein n=2 Tax=Larinioides sclopetarius TaxID=280406 RepID=A0AAV2BAT4_9ARAC
MPGDSTSERFTLKMCGEYAIANVLRRTCKCTPLVRPAGGARERICEPSDVYHCLLGKSLKNNLSRILNECHEPCIVYKYQTAVTCMRIGSANISRVQILYDAHQFMYFQYRTTTFSSIFSKIGGSLGLYIGASIITVVEISTFLMSWLWFRICPSKEKYKEKCDFNNHSL